MKTKNKFLVIILIVLTMINCIYPIANAVTCNLGSDISLTGYGSVANHVRNSESGDYAISTDLVGYYDNGVFYPAYCLNRDKSGADNEYTHTVNVSHILANEDLYNKIWRVVVAGYPFHSAEELGVDDWTYAYQATKTAIYDILGQTDVNNYYGTDDIGRRTVALMKRLVNEGENGTATYKTPVSTINTSGNLQLSGNYYIQNYTVTANVEIESFDIILPGFPTGTITTNTSGIQKSQFIAGETFQVRIPKNAVETGDINGRVLANVNTKSYPIFYGKTYDSKLQNYAITADPIMLTNSSKSLTLQGNTASIQIKKIDTDTNEPIANTVFQLSKQDGSVIGTVTTNSSGIATFNNLYQGNYIIEEITANNNYVSSSELTNATATYNQTTNITITNEKKKGQIKVVKIDKDNNETRLAGIEFEIRDANGNIVDKITTDNNGEAISKRLPINQSYTIRETKTLNNYVLNQEVQTVHLQQDQITTKTFENEKRKGQIRVIKTDMDYSNILLEGVEFEILDSNNKVVDKIVTNKNGEAVSKRLPIDQNYTIRETKTLETYLLNEETKTISIQENAITDVTFTNKHKEGNLEVFKIDRDNNKITLGNVEFDLYSNEFGKVIGTYYTNVDGEIHIKNLRIGNYKLIEKTTNKWYSFPSNPETNLQINHQETTSISVENELKKGQIKLVKVDKDNNELRLAGIKFNVLDNNNNILETIVTDSNGEAITNRYPVRDYETLRIQECETLWNYKLNDEIKTIELTAEQITNITVENELKKGQVRVIKVDKDNNEIRLQGVEFKIYDEDNNLVDTIITDENGEAISKRLRIDKEYTVIESKTLSDYVLNEEPQNVVLTEDEITDIVFENELKKGQAKVVKVDLDNNEIKLQGVKFDVIDGNGNILETITTNENGEAFTSKYPIRDYKELILQEKETLQEYVLNDTPQTVELYFNEITTIEFSNELKKGQIKIIKTDLDNNEIRLEGVKFNVYDNENNLVTTLITDENGEAITDRLPINKTYTIKEIETNEIYILNENTVTVVLEENEIKTLTFENEKKKGQIEIVKIDSENKKVYIPDVTFEVYNSEQKLVDRITTDKNGKAITKRLPIDDEYTIKETISNKAYVLTEETQTVVLEENEIKSITFENTKKYGQLKINKLSSNYSKILDLPANSPLANTKFLVVNEKGDAMGIYTTDETGSILTGELPYGKYTVYEYEVPEHFLKDAEPQEISITEDNQIIELTFKNSPKEPELPKTGF